MRHAGAPHTKGALTGGTAACLVQNRGLQAGTSIAMKRRRATGGTPIRFKPGQWRSDYWTKASVPDERSSCRRTPFFLPSNQKKKKTKAQQKTKQHKKTKRQAKTG